jgi:hypothetical protein
VLVKNPTRGGIGIHARIDMVGCPSGLRNLFAKQAGRNPPQVRILYLLPDYVRLAEMDTAMA